MNPTGVTGRRAVAFVLDAVVVAVLVTVLWVVSVVSRYDQGPVPAGIDPAEACDAVASQFPDCVVLGSEVYVARDGAAVSGTPLVLVAVLLVLVVMPGLVGVTPGKLVCGIRIVGPDGRRPGVGRCLVRTALWVVDGFPWIVPLLGWLLAATTRNHRRLGDLVAGTYVVRRR